MIWSNLIIVNNRKFEKLTFSTKSDSESTKSTRARTVKTKGYSKSCSPLINREDYEILYGLMTLTKFRWTFSHSYSTFRSTSKVHPEWISGFTDAEGSFSLKIIKRSGYKLGWGVEPGFIIVLHAKDLPLLEKIQSYFGVGNIHIGNNNAVSYYVNNTQDLTNVIIPHFDKYPLNTQKRADYLLFKSALNIIKQMFKIFSMNYWLFKSHKSIFMVFLEINRSPKINPKLYNSPRYSKNNFKKK